jgi:hypothetical protein
MKSNFIFLLLTLFFAVTTKAQVCIDINNQLVTASTLASNGNQLHTVDLELIHDGNVPVVFTAACNNGTIIGANSGTLLASGVTDNTFEVELNPNEVEAQFTFTPTNLPNSCPNNVYIVPVPKVSVCLDWAASEIVECYYENDGVFPDGEVHVYQVTWYNDSPGSVEFDFIADGYSTAYNRTTINAYETISRNYEIYIEQNNYSGILKSAIQGQNLENGCYFEFNSTFEECLSDACLEVGQGSSGGCLPLSNGDFHYLYTLDVINQSNTPLQYSIISTTGSIPSGVALTIAPNTTETISFEYIPQNQTDSEWSFNLEVETLGVNNPCAEIITLPLPSCNPLTGSMEILAFIDLNRNGTKDSNEPGLENVEYKIINPANGMSNIALTNAQGIAIFTDLAPSLYVVNQTIDAPWTVFPSGGALNNVLVEANKTTQLVFANVHPNQNIDLIVIENLSGICSVENNGPQSFYFSGFVSTSFLYDNQFSISDVNGGSISNLAIGNISSLANRVPFSFKLNTNADPCFKVTLSNQVTKATDTICVTLPLCCTSSTDTITTILKQNVKINHGTFVPISQTLKVSELVINNIEECVNKIVLSSSTYSIPTGNLIKDQDTIVGGPNSLPATYTINNEKEIKIYLETAFALGDLYITFEGCTATYRDTVKILENTIGQNVVSISQEEPSFANVYGAEFQINVNSNAKPKFISFGFADFLQTAKILGATGGNYYFFGRSSNIARMANMKNDDKQINLELNPQLSNDARRFQLFYTGPTKVVKVAYTVHDENGKLLGQGTFMLDGDKIVSKIEDPTVSEDDLVVYPNPAKDFINVVANVASQNNNYIITNVSGQQLRTGKCTDKTTVNLNGLATGIYFIEVTDDFGNKIGKEKFLVTE